ncbi:cupin domain-containing protein [Tellurirhabdus rosea]|uniref:cupin domain-containing protein n=1 Tax=Tellurirhabdus rosea TaxID=2674997 RepID=UPI002252B631|nr:cupin domain-containing protein [Tellurirhabdus rosea]
MAYANKVIRNPQTGQQIRFLQTNADTGGELLEMESTFQPHSTEPVPHYHPRQSEDFRVLSGELTVRLGDRTTVLKAGETLHLPARAVHSMWNDSGQPAVVNWRVQPAGATEHFLETAMGLAADGKVSAGGMPPLLQTALLVTHFSGVFRLVRPPFWVQQVVFTVLSPVARLAGYRPFYRQYFE